ncbi:MAG: histidine--tRNA ligase [Chitinophagales bacterium]
MDISAPRGTYDTLPDESRWWQLIEERLRRVAGLYGYREIRLPIFEHTELFERGVGDTTDIVQKEMYTFLDRGNRSLTLRPEGTASSVRAFVEHRLYNQSQPTKWFYIGPMFRYDRPESGRYRQFNQFGLEAFGSREPVLDAEVVSLMVKLVESLGLTQYELHLNTVGCPGCRPLYRERLVQYLQPMADKLCPDCRQRVEKNPLRVLDCKQRGCQDAIKGFPVLAEYLCDRCKDHFEQVKTTLEIYGVKYVLDSQLVRGLDYYTNTAFEILLPGIGAQSAVGGGGRYDGLIEQLGGPPTPGIGFALGLERLLLAMKSQNQTIAESGQVDVFVAIMDMEYEPQACALLNMLRNHGISSDMDYLGRSLKAQMKYANKSAGARMVVIIGEEEIKEQFLTLRNMESQEQMQVAQGEIVNKIKSILGI